MSVATHYCFEHRLSAQDCPLDAAYSIGKQTFMARVVIEPDPSRGQTLIKCHASHDFLGNWPRF